jgi:hypothetical protein
MITKQALEIAQEVGARRVLARYGLEKEANVFGNIASGVGSGVQSFGKHMAKGNVGKAFTKGWKNLGEAGQGAAIGAGAMYLGNKLMNNQRPYGY